MTILAIITPQLHTKMKDFITINGKQQRICKNIARIINKDEKFASYRQYKMRNFLKFSPKQKFRP